MLVFEMAGLMKNNSIWYRKFECPMKKEHVGAGAISSWSLLCVSSSVGIVFQTA